MKKSKIQNDEVGIEEIDEEANEEHASSENDSKKKNTFSSRRKSGSCGWKSIGGAVFAFFVFVSILGAIGFGTVWMLDNGKNVTFRSDEKKPLSEAVKSAEEKVSTNLESVDKSKKEEKNSNTSNTEEKKPTSFEGSAKVAVLVLNAGGAKGSAGKVADALKQAGFSLAKTGNASVFTYTGITVYYSDEASKAGADAIATALKKDFPSVNVKKASATDEKKEKIVVMVGA